MLALSIAVIWYAVTSTLNSSLLIFGMLNLMVMFVKYITNCNPIQLDYDQILRLLKGGTVYSSQANIKLDKTYCPLDTGEFRRVLNLQSKSQYECKN